MKRVLICLLAMLLLVPSFAFANKFTELETVRMYDSFDNTTRDYSVVNLLLNGNDVISDVPAIIYNLNGYDRTLVPISAITDRIGATISWDDVKKEATILHNGNTIVLTIDKATALVNGTVKALPNDIPAKLMSYNGTFRTMVPVNFVVQQLGYKIFWDGASKTVSINLPKQEITAITYNGDGNYPELRFKVTGEVAMTSFGVNGELVGGKDTLTLDFQNTELNLTEALKYDSVIVNDIIHEVYNIELSQTSGIPSGVRATVNLGKFRNSEVEYDEVNKEMVVRMINSVKYVDVGEVAGENAVIVETTEGPAFNVLREGNRVYVDIIHTKLQEEDNEIVVNKNGIKNVFYQQFDDSNLYDEGTRFTRVTINLDGSILPENVYVEAIDSKVVAFVKDQLNGRYSYTKNYEMLTSAFGLELNGPVNISPSYSSVNNQISFKINKSDVKKVLELGEKATDDGLVNKILVADKGDAYEFTLTLVEGTTYNIMDGSENLAIAFANESLQNSEYKDYTIVVDAGHGGHDPGASSPNGTREKDVVLNASLVLKKKLENAGFKVYLTRERDNFVNLYERASIANQLGADIFVSVHANAAYSRSANGIETLYHPDPNRNNKALAQDIQTQMINRTGAVNRGVVSRPDLAVTRATKMDAVLVELGFLSNATEEQRLLSPSYIENCATAIVDGIKDFLE